jgi:hypothetical protein
MNNPLHRWITPVAEGPDPGISWETTFSGRPEQVGDVYNHAVIPQPLTVGG